MKRCAKFHFATKFSSIFLLHGKHSFGKVINKVWYQACDLMRIIQFIQRNTWLFCQWLSCAQNKRYPLFECPLSSEGISATGHQTGDRSNPKAKEIWWLLQETIHQLWDSWCCIPFRCNNEACYIPVLLLYANLCVYNGIVNMCIHMHFLWNCVQSNAT